MNNHKKNIHVDIFENRKKIRVVVELHGVSKEDIRVELNEDILTISANRGNQSYYSDLRLPRVSDTIVGQAYNNGILEVTLN